MSRAEYLASGEPFYEILRKIDFLPRFRAIAMKYPYTTDSIKEVDIDRIQFIIEMAGYDARYNKRHKFFKIPGWKSGDCSIDMHLAVVRGKAEFIFSAVIDGEGMGGVYPALVMELEELDGVYDEDKKVVNPFFKTYEEFEEIFAACMELYEEVKMEMQKRKMH